MDYNYVRMRNAIKENNYERAQYYKELYENGKNKTKAVPAINLVIAALLALSVLLGLYILHSETKLAELNVNIHKEEVSPIPVVGEVS